MFPYGDLVRLTPLCSCYRSCSKWRLRAAEIRKPCTTLYQFNLPSVLICFFCCRTLAEGYDIPKTYLETNEIPHGQSDLSDAMNPSLQPLTKKQRKLVEKNPGSLIAIAQGARLAIKECQYQFRGRQWNCPVKDSNVGGSIFGKILSLGEGKSTISVYFDIFMCVSVLISIISHLSCMSTNV